MRPVPVPSEVRDADWVTGTQVFAAPSGDLTDPVIPPAEGIFYSVYPNGSKEGTIWPCVGVILELEDNDIEAITTGARHLLMGWPGVVMPVFMVPEFLDIGAVP